MLWKIGYINFSIIHYVIFKGIYQFMREDYKKPAVDRRIFKLGVV